MNSHNMHTFHNKIVKRIQKCLNDNSWGLFVEKINNLQAVTFQIINECTHKLLEIPEIKERVQIDHLKTSVASSCS